MRKKREVIIDMEPFHAPIWVTHDPKRYGANYQYYYDDVKVMEYYIALRDIYSNCTRCVGTIKERVPKKVTVQRRLFYFREILLDLVTKARERLEKTSRGRYTVIDRATPKILAIKRPRNSQMMRSAAVRPLDQVKDLLVKEPEENNVIYLLNEIHSCVWLADEQCCCCCGDYEIVGNDPKAMIIAAKLVNACDDCFYSDNECKNLDDERKRRAKLKARMRKLIAALKQRIEEVGKYPFVDELSQYLN